MGRPKKIIHFKLKEHQNASGTKSWRVTGTKPDGTRVRQNFSEKADAILARSDLEAELVGVIDGPRTQRTRLTTEELSDAEGAVATASGRNISKIVAHYLALEKRAAAKNTHLDAAISFFEANFRSEFTEISILNAYAEFLESRPEGPAKTKSHYESSLKLLYKTEPNKAVHGFTVSDIEKILIRYKNPNSRKTYRRAFSVFFNWAVRHHYCLENPCVRLDRMPKDTTQIAVLKMDEIQRLLFAAMNYQEGVAVAPSPSLYSLASVQVRLRT